MTTTITKPAVPQYASTTDPAVLAAIAAEQAARIAFYSRVDAFVDRLSDGEHKAMISAGFGLTFLHSVAGPMPGAEFGRWKKATAGGPAAWQPFKNNPITAEFDSLRHRYVGVPGLPVNVRLNGGGGRTLMANATLFAHDGVAYWGFSAWGPEAEHAPVDPAAHGWSEILASTFHGAVEALESAHQSEAESR